MYNKEKKYHITFGELGIEVSDRATGEERARCPKCSHNRRKSKDKCLSANLYLKVWHCFNCGWHGRLGNPSLHAYKRLLDISRAKPKSDSLKKYRRIWNESVRVQEACAYPLRKYLVEERGLKYVQDEVGVCRDLNENGIRFHPDLAYYDDGKCLGNYPAMVCRFVDKDGVFKGLHVTYLTYQGKKAPVSSPKKMFGQVKGAHIRLYKFGSTVAVVEGIETGIAVGLGTGKPVVSTGSASGMENVQVPEGVSEVHVYADNDANGMGQRTARRLKSRLESRGIVVEVFIPPSCQGVENVDFLDFYTRKYTEVES